MQTSGWLSTGRRCTQMNADRKEAGFPTSHWRLILRQAGWPGVRRRGLGRSSTEPNTSRLESRLAGTIAGPTSDGGAR
jgi:hypothetical protein